MAIEKTPPQALGECLWLTLFHYPALDTVTQINLVSRTYIQCFRFKGILTIGQQTVVRI